MKRYTTDFIDKLNGFDFETLEKSNHIIYGLSMDLEFIYMNPQWVTFAEENGADASFLRKFPLSTPIADAIRGDRIKKFYIQNYQRVLDTGIRWHHEFECSAKDTFRQYHQGAYPFKDQKGIIIINTLLVNISMDYIDRKNHDAIEKRYVQSTGFITQCSNCRHTQRADDPNVWEWVPTWVEHPPENTSHSICPTCYDYHWKYSRVKYVPKEVG